MADIESALISELAANNTAPAPDGLPAGSSPTIVYSEGREVLGMAKRWWNRNSATITSAQSSSNNWTLTYGVAPAAYIQGQAYSFIAHAANSGALTININGLGAKNVQASGVALKGGEISLGQIVEIALDNTSTFQIISGQGTFLPVSGPGLAGTTTGGLYNDVGRNKLHNAMFRIQQRGTGTFGGGVYSADRWQTNATLDTYSVGFSLLLGDTARTAIGDEEALYTPTLIITGNAGATAGSTFQQKIEGVRRLSNKTVTVSFWAWANTAGLKMGVSLEQLFGTGGSPSTTVNGTGQSVTLTTTPTRYSLTFTLPSTSGKTLGTNNDDNTCLFFWLSAGTNSATRSGNIGVQSGTFNLWGTQLEIGSVATPLEKIDIALDRAECMRFYQQVNVQWNGYGGAGASNNMNFQFPTAMRAAPILTPSFSVQNNCSGSSIVNTGTVGQTYQLVTNSTALGGFACVGSFTASADL